MGRRGGGALRTEYLRPGELTIYADKVPVPLAVQHRFLSEPRPGHTMIVEVWPAHPMRIGRRSLQQVRN